MYEGNIIENDSWSYTSMVSADDLQCKVSSLHATIDQLRKDIQDREKRVSQLENDKYLLQKQDENNKSEIQKLERDVVLLKDKIKKQNSVEAVMTEKDKVIQELRDAVATYKRKLDDFVQEEKEWTKKSEKMEKEIQLLKEKLQSDRSTACCCKQSQVNVNQQRGSHKRLQDKVLPLFNISEKLNDDTLYDQTHFDFRCHREVIDNKNEGMTYCENCNTKAKTGKLSMCQHELCRKCIQIMSTRAASKTEPMTSKQSVTCLCSHCTMKVSWNEVENLLTTLSSC